MISNILFWVIRIELNVGNIEIFNFGSFLSYVFFQLFGVF